MKNSLSCLVFSLSLLGATAAYAGPAGNFGAGLVLGEPTGLSAKYWIAARQALDFTVAYDFDHYFLGIVDYKYHFPGALHRAVPQADLSPYVGLGLVSGWGTRDNPDHPDRTHFFAGLRIPLGLEWLFARGHLGVFVEIAPGLQIAPGTDELFEGGIGIRYFF